MPSAAVPMPAKAKATVPQSGTRWHNRNPSAGAGATLRAISIIGLGMLVGACASSEVKQILPPRPIICIVGADCDAKWSRAVAWIKTNSTLKVQAQTDTVVQTAGPVGLEPTPAFTVTKVA